MLNGKELILATKPYAKEIRAKSWLYMLSTFFILISLITGIFIFDNAWIKLGCSVLAGFVNIRMFVIYHDHQHHTILYKSKVADAIMILYGIYFLTPSSIWKRSHDHHHAHNSKLFGASIGSYPIATKKKFLAMSKKEKRSYLASRHPLTIAGGYVSMFIVGMCIKSFMSNPKKHIDSLISLIIHFTAAVLIFIFFGWKMWLLVMFLPFAIPFAIGAYLFYVQHNFPGVVFSDNSEWKYEKAALESSSYLRMNRVMEWFTANIGYHHIHHINARIPFYRLPEVMKAIPELQHPKTTTFKIKDIIACFKLKVWDSEAQRMVGLDQLGS